MNAGTYNGQFKKAVTTESGAKKTPTLALTFDVTHFAEGADWVEVPVTERTVFMYLSDAAWPYTSEKLQKLGFNGDFDNPTISQQQVSLELTHESYNGQTKERWSIAGGGSFEAEPAGNDVTRRLNALWKNDNGGPKAKPAGRQAAPPKKPSAKEVAGAMAAQAPTNASDVPF